MSIDSGLPIAIVCPGPVAASVRISDLAMFEQLVTADRDHPTHRFVSTVLSGYPGGVAWIDVWPDAAWKAQPVPMRFDEEKPPTPAASRYEPEPDQ